MRTACRKLNSFKHWYVSQHETKVEDNRMNLRNKRNVAREKNLEAIMIEFDSRSEAERVHNLPNFCVKKSRLLISCRATFVYQKK